MQLWGSWRRGSTIVLVKVASKKLLWNKQTATRKSLPPKRMTGSRQSCHSNHLFPASLAKHKPKPVSSGVFAVAKSQDTAEHYWQDRKSSKKQHSSKTSNPSCPSGWRGGWKLATPHPAVSLLLRNQGTLLPPARSIVSQKKDKKDRIHLNLSYPKRSPLIKSDSSTCIILGRNVGWTADSWFRMLWLSGRQGTEERRKWWERNKICGTKENSSRHLTRQLQVQHCSADSNKIDGKWQAEAEATTSTTTTT